MKKIIIVSDSLRIGGIQQALKNFLNIIDYDKFQVDLFLFHSDKKEMSKLKSSVNLIKSSRVLEVASSTGEEAKRKGSLYYLLRKIIAMLCHVFGSNTIFNYLFMFDINKKKYDYAISFSNNINNNSVYFGQNKFVLEKINAKKKYTWLHVDYDEMKLNNIVNKKEYDRFDKIICVSEAVKNYFTKNHPEFKDKCRVVYNSIDSDYINKFSNEYSVDFKSCFNIVSVGRLDENKSPLSYVNIAKKIRNCKIDFHWWIIGDGPQYRMIKSQLIKHKLDDYVTLLGELSNPYPYVVNADLFVSASLSESFGIAIVESLCLNTPVISRYFPAIEEYLINGHNGIIVYGDDIDLANKVIDLIQNKEMYSHIKNNTKYIINKNNIINKFESILEEDQ